MYLVVALQSRTCETATEDENEQDILFIISYMILDKTYIEQFQCVEEWLV